MNAVVVIAKKEIVDNVRDRRAMATALFTPLLGPLMLVAIFFALKDANEKSRSPSVPVVGRERAPELVAWLERNNVTVPEAPADPEEAVRKGKHDVVLRIPAGFDASLRAGTPATVEIVCDPTQTRTTPTLERVSALLEGYGSQIGSLRLMVRGVDPAIARAVRIERIDVGAPDAKKALLLASLPLFLLMACFLGGTYVAIDLTAGERERGSLEPLLMNPVAGPQLVLAKVLATVVFGLLSVAVALVGFSLVVPAIPFHEIGFALDMQPRVVASYVLLFLPTTVLAASVQILVGTISKTAKTAQAALGFIVLGPMLPGIVVTLFPQQPTLFNSMVPCLGEAILSLRILRGEEVQLVHWLANATADLVVAALLVAITTRLFGPRMLSS